MSFHAMHTWIQRFKNPGPIPTTFFRCTSFHRFPWRGVLSGRSRASYRIRDSNRASVFSMKFFFSISGSRRLQCPAAGLSLTANVIASIPICNAVRLEGWGRFLPLLPFLPIKTSVFEFQCETTVACQNINSEHIGPVMAGSTLAYRQILDPGTSEEKLTEFPGSHSP